MANKESFDDIVFEDRNKEYGAYELRKKYSKRGSIALFISIFVLIIAVGAPLIASILNKEASNNYVNKDGTIVIDLGEPDEKIEVPPPPPPPPVSEEIKKAIFSVPLIVDSLTNEEDIMTMIDGLIELGNIPIDTFENIVIVVDDDNKFESIVEEPVFQIFEITETPTYEGGDIEMKKFISENVVYPQDAIENGIEGTVYIRFVVSATGKVDKVQVYRGVHETIDNEAVRVVKLMNKWQSGKQNGTPVSVWFVIPIKFNLQNKD